VATLESEPTIRRGRLSDSHAKAWDIRCGDVIADRFEVTRLIGRGGMGVVVEAKVRNAAGTDSFGPQHRVAIKILHKRHLDNPEAVARFAQEGRAYASVRGEHIVRILDTGRHEDRPFLVMELLSGADLESVMEEGPLPLEIAALYILQASEGMAEVHANGMVHRDLKPSNLFLTSHVHGSPMIKILDFGIAKGVIADDPALLVQTQTLVAMGTPLYMSPEQIRSSREVDARADIWSLGAIFYELVAGRPAFGGNTVTNITAQVLEADPPPLSSIARVPREVDAIVAKALAKHPNDRFVDVSSLARALEGFADPAGAGTAARCTRVLQGALRATGNPSVATSPPVTRDDGLGGTIRFDRKRRARVLRFAMAALSLGAIVLVLLAISAYRSTAPTGRTLAQRGLKSMIVRAYMPVSSARAPDGSAPVASTSPEIEPSATAIASPSTRPSGSVGLGAPSTWAPRPSAAPTDVSRPPSTAARPPPSSTAWSPFTERN